MERSAEHGTGSASWWGSRPNYGLFVSFPRGFLPRGYLTLDMSADSTGEESEPEDATISAELNLDDDEHSELSISGRNLSSGEVKLILAAVVVVVLLFLWLGPL